MSTTVATLSAGPLATLATNNTPIIEVVVLQDQSLEGILVWLNILAVVAIATVTLFELVRRNSRLSHIYYTRSRLVPNLTPPFPAALFGWVGSVFTVPDTYVQTKVGLDAYMLLSYLLMSFKLFLILAIVMLFILIPVNYSANNLNTQPFNITTPEAIVEVAARSISFFSINNIKNGSNTLWIHVGCTYLASLIAYLLLYQCYKTYTVSISGFLSGETAVDPSQELMFRTILITNIPSHLQQKSQLSTWLSSLDLGKIENIYMVADDDTYIIKIMKRRERNLRKLEKVYMAWAVNISREVAYSNSTGMWGYLCRRLPYSTTKMRELHDFTMDIPPHEISHEMIQRTRPQRIRSVRGMLIRQDAIRAYNSKVRSMTERIIWARTKAVVKPAAAQECPDTIGMYTNVLSSNTLHTTLPQCNPTDTSDPDPTSKLAKSEIQSDHEVEDHAIMDTSFHVKQPYTSGMMRFKAMLTRFDFAFYKRLHVCSCSAFVTFRDRRSAFFTQQLSLCGSSDQFPMIIQPAPEPKEILWASLSLSLMETVIKRSIVNIIAHTIALFWIIPTSFVSNFSRLDELGMQPQYSSFVLFISQYSWLRMLVTSVLPPLIIQISNMVMPYLFDALSGLQGRESTFKVQQSTFCKYFFFLVFNVHFVFTIFSAAWNTFSNLFTNPLSWLENIATSLPSGTLFFVNYLILNIILVPIELLRPMPYLFSMFGRSWKTTPREYYEVDVMASTINYAFTYPPQILIFVIVLCYSIISPVVLIPGAMYFGITWLVLKNQLVHVYVKKTENYGRMWIMAFNRSVLGLGLFQFTTAGLLSAKQAPIAAIVCGILVIVTWFFHRKCRSLFERHTQVAPLESLVRTGQRITQCAKGHTNNSDDIRSGLTCHLRTRSHEANQELAVLRDTTSDDQIEKKLISSTVHFRTRGASFESQLGNFVDLNHQDGPIAIQEHRTQRRNSSEICVAPPLNSLEAGKNLQQSQSETSANDSAVRRKSLPRTHLPYSDVIDCDHDLVSDIGISMISLSKPVSNAKEHQDQSYTLNYMSPAYSTPLSEPWIPEYISTIVREFGHMQGPEDIISTSEAYPTKDESTDSLV
ncbi:hypothetical protein BASA50_002620 [Batrachochytrium salamandrivorans]|uniref:CSC1/OSCA1-like 7TM region domain-containing protein n=1 Tax=Batrachochytrium salamandrivorans TaxID=1357716 RepID=A0ABQ8FKW3_9FUNG|nr:hypothetical protein BASA62_001095 [Batrachochytrium salamandrivorans]KAH6581030.1 hypothetical protein BASA61_009291 [Batrachochytrium salamandrivorans]KAH6600033.1 hypothetical protein BASA50_002620 [Batrachochytrium salamandrivorans]KAH9271238.1 hypothetical protein BASA83_006560 [Batrachochytrium salamandrivorans]